MGIAEEDLVRALAAHDSCRSTAASSPSASPSVTPRRYGGWPEVWVRHCSSARAKLERGDPTQRKRKPEQTGAALRRVRVGPVLRRDADEVDLDERAEHQRHDRRIQASGVEDGDLFDPFDRVHAEARESAPASASSIPGELSWKKWHLADERHGRR